MNETLGESEQESAKAEPTQLGTWPLNQIAGVVACLMSIGMGSTCFELASKTRQWLIGCSEQHKLGKETLFLCPMQALSL